MDGTHEDRGAVRRRNFVDLGEVTQTLLSRFPGLPRLTAAAARRRRLLRGLAAWRDEKLATQQTVADLIGSTQPAIARLELGKVDPRLSTLERYAAALDANFIWQVVGDDGKPVSYDFTWEADLEYRRNHPALGLQSGRVEELAGSAEPHVGSTEDVAARVSSSSVGTVPESTAQLIGEQITVPANAPPCLPIISLELPWGISDLIASAHEEEAAAKDKVLEYA